VVKHYRNRYRLQECPAWRSAFDKDGKQKKQSPTARPLWSNGQPPPPLEAEVIVRVNDIGSAIVVGYFVEYGYLGLHVMPKNPPAWYRKQNGLPGGAWKDCHVFGAEVGIG